MLSLGKHFQKPKRVSNAVPADPSFDVDGFIELIVLKQARQTTWKQNRYIRMQVERNRLAAQAWQDAMDTSPLERFSLREYHPPLMKVTVIILAAASIALGIYALTRYDISVSMQIRKKPTYNLRFTDKRLTEVATMIEDRYAKKVVFDREEISSKLLSGRMDTTRRVEDFLEDLRINGVDNYTDDKGLIHIK